MRRLRLRDEQLPTWAHSAIVVVIACVFGLPPAWWGIRALVIGRVPQMEKWDGTDWFGPHPLTGVSAYLAGGALLCLGLALLTLGTEPLKLPIR